MMGYVIYNADGTFFEIRNSSQEMGEKTKC